MHIAAVPGLALFLLLCAVIANTVLVRARYLCRRGRRVNCATVAQYMTRFTCFGYCTGVGLLAASDLVIGLITLYVLIPIYDGMFDSSLDSLKSEVSLPVFSGIAVNVIHS